jgi:hypothetical protein
MVKYIFWASLMMMGLTAGCVNVDAKAPENIPYLNSSPPPTSSIAKANPSSKSDLVRENQQLRERIAWLEDQNANSMKKSQKLKNEKQDIQGDIDKIAAERDRYKKALSK